MRDVGSSRRAGAGYESVGTIMPASRPAAKRLMISAALVAVVLAGFAAAGVGRFIDKSTPQYLQPIEHYKYGSIGTEPAGGLPYWIWKALPVLFRDDLGAQGFE